MATPTAATIPGFDNRRVELESGPIHYRVRGDGPPILFVHGFVVNGRFWEKVATRLASRFRCVVPDWPMGAHVEPMHRGADVTPPGVARMVAELCEALDLEDVTLVGNDSGGAVAQIAATRHRDRITRLALTNCDAFEQFPPGHFRHMARAMHLPGFTWSMAQSMRLPALRRSWIAYGLLTRAPIDSDLLDEWTRPSRGSGRIRRDMRRFFTGAHPSMTLEAVDELAKGDIPLAVIWGDSDRLFGTRAPERFAEIVPGCQTTWIMGGETFCPLEDDDLIAEAVASFVETTPGE